MRIIAFEAATARASIAFVDDADGLIWERTFDAQGRLSTLLLPTVAALEAEAWPVAAANLIVVAAGPGSFTGLRVALAAVKGLAFATGTPVATVNSLAAVAVGAGMLGRGTAVFDARGGYYFAAVYRVESGWADEVTPTALATARDLEMFDCDWFAGPPPRPESVPSTRWLEVWPRAATLARLGAAEYRLRGGCTLAVLRPNYLKRGQV